MWPLSWKRAFCSFVFIFSLLLTQTVLTVKEVLMRFVFYEFLGAAAEKPNKQKTSQVFRSVSLEWLNNALFGKEILLRLGLGLFHKTLLANQDRLNVLSVH